MPDILELQRRLKPALIPLGVLYGLFMRLRRWAFETGRLDVWRPNCPVVSVGNIGWGGSGKTPLCGHILHWAGKREEHAVVLTRGYGAKPGRLPLLVTRAADPAACGDEPLLLARSHPLARVVVDPKRRRSGPWAYERFDPDFVLLDDGFQHLPVARDIDLVLLTPQDLAEGWNRVCPAGTWREGQAALARASAFLVKTPPELSDGVTRTMALRLEPYGRPAFSFSLKPKGLMRVDGTRRAADFGGEDYVLATGIADPGQAASTAEQYLGRAPRLVLPFADHHAFSAQDLLRIHAAAAGAHVLVTAKDAVKLAKLPGAEGFWVLRTELAFGPSVFTDATFDQWFSARFAELAAHYHPLAVREFL
ncbi:MAG: tetraacyldisaccharide 4'-kinase [Humidesulfovibrio sp.]|nr:tetraacyldisaccharide 4'-kinase [Humidesulfovibrio sp.]